jgi:putative flavoprotein involved in K+ transport
MSDVVIVGAGPAGLATSCELTRAGVEHVVLERERIGQSWRARWDSFCLVTPNWSAMLPDHPYDRDDPDGFMPRDEIVAYFERYAQAVAAPVREGVAVTAVERDDTGFLLQTSEGALRAAAVVLATGTYARPHRPPGAAGLPAELLQIDLDQYRSPAALRAGAVLVVGSGQSGCQIAEELHLAGRDVFVACGRAPWLHRRIGDRDVVWWVLETGFLDAGVGSLPDPSARLFANILVTGHGGGRDLNLRTLRARGVTLLGHLAGADGRRARFAPDLAESLAWGDARRGQLVELIRELEAERGLAAVEIPEPEPMECRGPEELDLAGFGAVVFAAGFRPDHASWVRLPGAFDELGFPVQRDGASTVVDGLYFAGVHFQRKRKSATLMGMAEDAAIVAGAIATRAARAA